MSTPTLDLVQRQAEKLTPDDQVRLALHISANAKGTMPNEEALMSEKALAAEWLRPEEDEAWSSL